MQFNKSFIVTVKILTHYRPQELMLYSQWLVIHMQMSPITAFQSMITLQFRCFSEVIDVQY